MASALVVYESIFGDARKIAEAVAIGLADRSDVDVVEASEAPTHIPYAVTLLVVGGPNHGLRMPRQSTREAAVDQYGVDIEDTRMGLHEWLDAVRLPAGVRAAAFDTRMDHPKGLTALDHASRTEEKLLKRHDATIVAPAEHFRVIGAEGPLADGELERAVQWGRTLAGTLSPSAR